MRICTKCKQKKPFDEFVKNSSKAFGIDYWCLECARVIQKNRKEANRLKNKNIPLPENKICYNCKIKKDKNLFYKESTSSDGLGYYCKECCKEDSKNYGEKRREKNKKINKVVGITVKSKKCWGCDIEKQSEDFGKDATKEGGLAGQCKICVAKYLSEYNKQRKNNDPIYKLRTGISRTVGNALKKVGSGKRGGSILDHLPYTIDELKFYLESLFEPWMNWDNYGMYISKMWDDNNPNTWVWNLDHIIPQADLLYTSMENENFKKCWALSNLRPLSSKQNQLDGAGKTRHSKKNKTKD